MGHPVRASVVLLLALKISLAGSVRGVGAGELHINEILASNSSILADERSEYDDWIEIYNGAETAIDVAGMYLTDDLREPRRWRFPTDRSDVTRIAAGGYLLVWADGDPEGGAELHAGFRLDTNGEEIGLFDRDGLTPIDVVRFRAQTSDLSWGRYPDGHDAWRLMAAPSPGSANGVIYDGFVEAVQFSHDRGFYDEAFEVTLTTDTPEATVWYTTDGSEPGERAGRRISGATYSHRIRISTTTCLRAKAVRSGWHPSVTRTHTYLFLDAVANQPSHPAGFPTKWGDSVADYAMDPRIVHDPLHGPMLKQALQTHRTISLAFDTADLFDASRGIYVNSQKEGEAWERPVSMEILDPLEGEEIQVNAGLRMQGGASRSPSRPKHNMRLLFKGMYGTPKLEFPVFEDWPVQRFDTLILRGGNGDSWIHPNTIQQIRAQYIRDQWPRDTQHAMGRLTAGQCYVHLYLNGLYWGLYHVIERPNASFFSEHLGGKPQEYDVVQHKNGTVDGNRDAWNAMMSLANAGLASADRYRRIQEYVDLGNLIDYLLVNFYMGNVDWDHNNWYGGRRRGEGESFRFLSWDSERTFLSLGDDVTGRDNNNQPTHVHQQLMANSDYRLLFADCVQRRFFNGGVLAPEKAMARWNARAEEIRLPLIAESARWGDNKRPSDPYTPDVEWQAELDFLYTEYFPERTSIVFDRLKARGLYPDVEVPVLDPHGGVIQTGGFVALTAQAGTVWHTTDGSDPRLPETSQAGEEETIVAEDAPKRVFVPPGGFTSAWQGSQPFDDSDWTLVAGEPGGVGYERSSGYDPYILADVNDLMYRSGTSCFVRIPFTVDGIADAWPIMELRVRYDDGFIAYLNGKEIARRNFDGVPAADSRASTGHSDSQAKVWETIDVSGFLDHLRDGENLLAVHGLNVSPTSSDFLISVELAVRRGGSPAAVSPTAIRVTGPLTLERSCMVKTRAISGGAWSALNEATFSVGPVAESLRITEIMYHPMDDALTRTEPNAEFIELENRGDVAVDLNLVRFTEGIDFAFGPIVLQPGEIIVIVEDMEAFRAYHGQEVPVAGQYAGKLDNGGERIRLEDAVGRTITDFGYDDDWHKATDGRGHSLVAVGPADADSAIQGQKAGWRPSDSVGGSPGARDDMGE